MSSESNFTNVISKNDSKCTKFLLSTFYGSNKVVRTRIVNVIKLKYQLDLLLVKTVYFFCANYNKLLLLHFALHISSLAIEGADIESENSEYI